MGHYVNKLDLVLRSLTDGERGTPIPAPARFRLVVRCTYSTTSNGGYLGF